MRLTNFDHSLLCIAIVMALLSGCMTTTADLRESYRGKPSHKAFLICKGGYSAAAWGGSTKEAAISEANRVASSNYYKDCVLEDVDGKPASDYVFQQYMDSPDNRAFLQCRERVFAAYGHSRLSDAIQAVQSQAKKLGFSDCSITNTNGMDFENAEEDSDSAQRVFERPPDV